MPPLRADRVTVRYGSNCALDAVTFELQGGSSAALIGANGAGKTTLLHTLGGLVTPDEGSVASPEVVAYMPHHQRLQAWMPLIVSEVINMGCYGTRGLFRRLDAVDRRSVQEAAERLDVVNLLRRQFGELSTGQRQRVLMAQLLVQQAGLLLLDEPITGLDRMSQRRITDVIDEERGRGAIVVFSTHHLDEARHCDYVLVLMSGRLMEQGPPEDILATEMLRAAASDG
jgi:ABC-type Mn2+/Zn2+ transport system ATPase subunit